MVDQRPSGTTSIGSNLKKNKKVTPKYLYMTSINGAMSGYSFGFIIGVYRDGLANLGKEIDVKSWMAWLNMSNSAKVLWAFLFGFIINAIGRKTSLICSSSLITFSVILMVFSKNMAIIFVGDVLIAIAVAISSITTAIYLLEVAPKELRGSIASLFQVMFSGGILTGSFISALLWDIAHSWRIMFALMGVTPTLQLVGFFVFKFPESPRFLVMNGNVEAANEALTKMRGTENNKTEIRDIQTRVEMDKDKTGFAAFRGLFTTRHVRKALLAGCLTHSFMEMTGFIAVFIMSRRILLDYGFTKSATKWFALIPYTCYFLGNFIGVKLSDTWGTRRLYKNSFFACAVSCAFLSVSFYKGTAMSPSTSTVFDMGSSGECSKFSDCFGCVHEGRLNNCSYCAPKANNLEKGACVGSYTVGKGKKTKVFAKAGRCEKNNTVFEDMYISSKSCPNTSFTFFFIGLVLFMITYSAGVGPLTWYVSAEILPLWARANGHSFAMVIRRIFIVIMVTTFRSSNSVNIYKWFLVFAISSTIAGVVLSQILPEYLGKPLEWVECLFMKEGDRKQFIDTMIKNRSGVDRMTQEFNSLSKSMPEAFPTPIETEPEPGPSNEDAHTHISIHSGSIKDTASHRTHEILSNLSKKSELSKQESEVDPTEPTKPTTPRDILP